MPDEEKIQTLPLLPLKNSVLFPGLLMPLAVGRKASVAAVEAALATEDKEVIVVAQKDPTIETPGADDLYTVGTRAVIRKSGAPGPTRSTCSCRVWNGWSSSRWRRTAT